MIYKIGLGETFELPFEFQRDDMVYLNGYQSWTDSVEHQIKDSMRGLHGIPKAIVSKYALDAYGDYTFTEYPWKSGKMHGYTYGYIRRGNTYYLLGSITEIDGFTKISVDIPKHKIYVSKDLEGVDYSKESKEWKLFWEEGREEQVFDHWFSAMQINRPTAVPVSGYTSWYDYYEEINEEKINKHLSVYRNKNFKPQVFQIDDGYEEAVGDWLYPDQKKFPNGMKKVADDIKSADMIPGIWLAPFSCRIGSRLEREHPDWIICNEKGEKQICGNNWGGFYGLNLELPQVQEYVAGVFHTIIEEWGYQFLKLDFLYSVCLIPRNGKSRGKLMCEAMDFIRDHTQGALLLGCGVPLGAAFGKVDYCRIGCDVSLAYDDVWWMRFLHRERISTKRSIANTYYRRQLDGRAFLNDPDVYLLRDQNMKMNWKERKKLAEINAKYGSVWFTSDNPQEYNKKQNEFMKELQHKL